MKKLIGNFFPKHFSRIDRRGTFIAFFFAIIAFVALLKANSPRSLRNKETIAMIENFSNDVRFKEADSITFLEILKNEKIQSQDEIFTGANSRATVYFLKSKTKLQLPSSSLIAIEDGEHGETIEIKEGLVDIILQKDHPINIKVNGIEHQIIPSLKKSSVKAYYYAGELHLFTKEKDIKIKTAGKEYKLEGNREAVVQPNNVKIDTSFILISPTPGQIINEEEGLEIKTNLKEKYQINISKNIDFKNLIATQYFENKNFKLNFSPDEGEYFFKIDNGKNNKIVPISFVSKFKINGCIPKNGETIKINPNDAIDLKWEKLPVSSYRLMIKEADQPEKIFTTKENFFHLSNISSSEFVWTISSEVSVGEYSRYVTSSKVSVEFTGQIDLIKPPQKTKYTINDEQVNLTWTNLPKNNFLVSIINSDDNKILSSNKVMQNSFAFSHVGYGNLRVEVSSIDYPSIKKADFHYQVVAPVLEWNLEQTKMFKSEKDDEEIELQYKSFLSEEKNINLNVKYTSNNGNEIEKKIKLEKNNKIKLNGFGKYCFQAQQDEQEKYLIASDEYCLDYIYSPVFGPLPKAPDLKLVLSKRAGHDSFKISVPKIKNAEIYYFEIFQDPEGRKRVHSAEAKLAEFYWSTDNSGIYYIRYKVADSKKRESEFSPISKFIFPISPLSDWH
jgi:hypothetical protein